MERRTTRTLGWITVLMLAAAAPALAEHHEGHGKKAAEGAKSTGPSAENRARMADAHEKMALCLRSTRPIHECRSEMKKAHQGAGRHAGHDCDCSMHGEGEQCTQHGDGHGGHGKGKGKTDGSAPAGAPASAPAMTPSSTPTKGKSGK